MFEAVGYEYYGAYFGQCSRLLKPDGRMFLQTIYKPDQLFDAYRRDFDWIRKHIFPGSLLASVYGIAHALKHHTAMRIEWMQDIGVHYARTLHAWRERFMSHVPEVRQLGFDDRFIRMWEFYLASCEAAFATRYLGDAQMILAKPSVW
jgi:cyclopropane-fatty-acyl-phospholipid synthase